ncbi:type II secretion system protein GspL [Ottowia thiooxydans]|uniref:type II secretion system protein GspL n=1 Tax=Ottowia thiooxydans TaxID=219182 RepID=UPI000417A51A|nr:type II secretion system protein GspL [Ottowia thiooxydans]
MSLLLISLPSGSPGTYDFATSRDGQTVAAHGSAAPGLLPPAGRGVEVVAMVPPTLLSWQRVQLPKGIGPGSPRLRATLAGLLEEHLLDDADQLHFSLEPGASGGSTAWVAVCNRPWLSEHLHALDAAGRTVNRIVPELSPRTGPLRLIVAGVPERAQLLISGDAVPGGVQALPLGPGALSLLPQPISDAAGNGEAQAPELLAEPAVAALAEQTLGYQPTIQQAPERLLAATRSSWDLAQFDFSLGGRARAAKRAGALWRDLMYAPAWRPARWGVALLLLAQLVGLNWLAWQTRTDLAARRTLIDSALTQTFPQVKVVVDAPVQMAREVATLRQASGAFSARDLEPVLSAFALVAPAGAAPSAIEFSSGELRARGVQMAASALAEANQRLRPMGYQMQTETDAIVLRPEGVP